MQRATATVNLAAIARNVNRLATAAAGARFMAVVKADGYGHGMIPVARTCRDAGADYLGVALPSEAEALRSAGDTGRILAWLYAPGDDLAPCVAQGVDLSIASLDMLEQILDAVARAGSPARLHLKVDTGLGRNGSALTDWPALLAAVRRAEAAGQVEIVGIWSHLACADEPDSPVTGQQIEQFTTALAAAAAVGIEPELRHLANSAGVLFHSETHFDLVRCGISVYGLTPGPAAGSEPELGLEPAMTVQAALALVKDAPAGQGVSYGLRYRTATASRLALVPVGYADGVPRAGSGCLPVQLAGQRYQVAGTVAMDQVVLDIGDLSARAGDVVTLFGSGTDGAPTATEWAETCGTINYEIVTRLGARIPREYVGHS